MWLYQVIELLQVNLMKLEWAPFSWNGGKTEILNVLFDDVFIGLLSFSGGNLLTGKRMFEVSNTSIYEKKHKYQNNTQWRCSYVLSFEQL